MRELAHVEKIVAINPIEGADKVELATVLGWRVMVKKGQFHVGDLGVYIEIDSRCPKTEAFAFLESKHYAVKTQKYFKGTVISQGLLMHPTDLGLDPATLVEGQGLTELLGITYYEPEDNIRKAPSADKYKRMAQRHPKIFSKPWARWMMKRGWGKKLMFLFFGRKKDRRSGWPEWVVKTDEERVQNCPWILEDKSPWVATEKIDGTSATYTLKRGNGFRKKDEFYVCSRNVVQLKEDQDTYYKTNVYWEIAKKYDIEKVLHVFLENNPDAEWVTIQGEIFGDGIQKRNYSMQDHDFRAFNLIMSHVGRLPTPAMADGMSDFGIKSVPIIDTEFILPDTVDELLEYATGTSEIDGGMREGIVFRSQDGSRSFKAVSNEFLLKYHG